MYWVASQGKQVKLDGLGFDKQQRVGYSRHREQPEKDTETGNYVAYWRDDAAVWP